MGLFRRTASLPQENYIATSIATIYPTATSGKTAKEQSWQTKCRYFDTEGPGFVGFSLDLVALLASLADVVVVDQDGNAIDDNFVQGTAKGIRWATSLEENIFTHVRQHKLVGEKWIGYTTKGWVVAATPQLYPEKAPYTHVLLRENATPKEEWLADTRNALPLLNVPTRHINSSNTYSGEPTSEVRRTLRELELYTLLLQGIVNDQKSLSQWAKIVYLGEDDNKWRQDPKHSSQGVPPRIKDFYTLGKGREFDTPSQAYPYMAEQAPQVIHLATPIDSQLIPLLDYLTKSYARATNVPARMLSDGSGNHDYQYLEWDNLIKIGVQPPLETALRDITEVIWRPAIKKLKESGEIPINIIPEQCYLAPNLEEIARSSISPQDLISLFNSGVTNLKQIRKILNIPEAGAFELPKEISENELREQSLNRAGRKGSTPDNKADQDAPKQAAIGPTTYRDVKGYGLDDKLNRLELRTWGELQGVLDTEVNNILNRVGRKIIRHLTDIKTASAKTILESFKDTPAELIPLQADRTFLAANGLQLDEEVEKERRHLEVAVIAIFAAANLSRTNILNNGVSQGKPGYVELPDYSRIAAEVASQSILEYIMSFKGYEKAIAEGTTFAGEQIVGRTPPWLARQILQAAGGADVAAGKVIQARDGAILYKNKPALGGYANGPVVQEALKEKGYDILWEWYHDHPKNPFPPHVALAGVQFRESEMTQVTGGMHPGDHVGCQCSFQIVIADSPAGLLVRK